MELKRCDLHENIIMYNLFSLSLYNYVHVNARSQTVDTNKKFLLKISYNGSQKNSTCGEHKVTPTVPIISSAVGGVEAKRIFLRRKRRATNPHDSIRESSSPGHIRLPEIRQYRDNNIETR